GYIVPNRFEYGYGLSPEIVALAAREKPDVLVTVDNGIADVAGVAAANALGIDVVVTDHHMPGAQLPEARVIVNPNQPGCGFPSKNLAGVGVMFYVLLALRAELRKRGVFTPQDQPRLDALLDLVALGTVAD
ncbi:DHH family phosphoesterase, partial [Escherichia coli]|nr:DHH family phosphoesterase [Escherichia coli]